MRGTQLSSGSQLTFGDNPKISAEALQQSKNATIKTGQQNKYSANHSPLRSCKNSGDVKNPFSNTTRDLNSDANYEDHKMSNDSLELSRSNCLQSQDKHMTRMNSHSGVTSHTSIQQHHTISSNNQRQLNTDVNRSPSSYRNEMLQNLVLDLVTQVKGLSTIV